MKEKVLRPYCKVTEVGLKITEKTAERPVGCAAGVKKLDYFVPREFGIGSWFIKRLDCLNTIPENSILENTVEQMMKISASTGMIPNNFKLKKSHLSTDKWDLYFIKKKI